MASLSSFFSREHEPIHIHVVGNGGGAKYVWDGAAFNLEHQHSIMEGDLRRVNAMIDENSDIIVRQWNRYFRNV